MSRVAQLVQSASKAQADASEGQQRDVDGPLRVDAFWEDAGQYLPYYCHCTRSTHEVSNRILSIGQAVKHSTVHRVLSTSSSDGSGGSSAA